MSGDVQKLQMPLAPLDQTVNAKQEHAIVEANLFGTELRAYLRLAGTNVHFAPTKPVTLVEVE